LKRIDKTAIDLDAGMMSTPEEQELFLDDGGPPTGSDCRAAPVFRSSLPLVYSSSSAQPSISSLPVSKEWNVWVLFSLAALH
jgi:hypothetical protein